LITAPLFSVAFAILGSLLVGDVSHDLSYHSNQLIDFLDLLQSFGTVKASCVQSHVTGDHIELAFG